MPRRPWWVGGPALLVFAAALAASCGGEDGAGVADGADLERTGDAAMGSVTFTDVAIESGLDFRHSAFRFESGPDPNPMMSGGLCWVDYDRDGWLDLFLVDTWTDFEWGEWRAGDGIPTSRLYRNESGRFTDVTGETGTGLELRGSGCVAADLDLDGWTDLYVTSQRDNVLLWNDEGDGFLRDEELEVPAGVRAFGWHSGAAVGDLDGNGWPDMYVAGYADMNRPIISPTKGFPNTHEPEPDLVFLNRGPQGGARAVFDEVGSAAGVEPSGPTYGLGVVLSDLDLDGDLDVYVANDTNPNELYANARRGAEFRLVEQGVDAGVGDDGAGMGVDAADADADGRADLVTTNQLEERHVLVRNDTVSPDRLSFLDGRAAAGVPDFGDGLTGWGTSWSDIDLDGDTDLLVANGATPVRREATDAQPAQLLENRLDVDGVLVDASATTGLADLGPYVGRGLAMADYDNDGDLDAALGTIGGQVGLLRNSGAGGNWLMIDLGTAHPGAVATVTLPDGRELRREVTVGGSYLSGHDHRIHFGLGAADTATEVVIGFPDGAEIRLEGVTAGQIVDLDPDDRR